jgi:hypothetical protein
MTAVEDEDTEQLGNSLPPSCGLAIEFGWPFQALRLSSSGHDGELGFVMGSCQC